MSPLIFYKLALFFGYPALSLFFMWSGLTNVWGAAIIIFSAGIMFLMSILLAGPISRHSPSFYGVHVFVLLAWALSITINPESRNYAAQGTILTFISITMALLIFKKIMPSHKYINPYSKVVFLIYWLIFVTAAAVPMSVGLASLSNKINFIPVFVYGLVFGWFGPEVTYKIIDGSYEIPKVVFLECVLIVSLGFFYNFLGIPDLIVSILPLLSVPSMLISRIVLKELEHG